MQQRQEQGNKKYVFVDTCVIQAAGSSQKSKSEIVIKSLQDIAFEAYRLAISEFTIYEILHGLWGKRAVEVNNLLKSYERKIVSDKVLTLAASLGGLYHDEKLDGIDTGDKIIASTAFLEGGFVLTENHRDYPHPFFLTEKSIPLTYEVSHHKKTIDLALYMPHIELINRRISEKE